MRRGRRGRAPPCAMPAQPQPARNPCRAACQGCVSAHAGPMEPRSQLCPWRRSLAPDAGSAPPTQSHPSTPAAAPTEHPPSNPSRLTPPTASPP